VTIEILEIELSPYHGPPLRTVIQFLDSLVKMIFDIIPDIPLMPAASWLGK